MSFIYSVITLLSKIIIYYWWIIEIDVIVVKKYFFFNFVEMYVRLKREKEVNVIITIIIKYARILLNELGSEYASGPKYVKTLEFGKVLSKVRF